MAHKDETGDRGERRMISVDGVSMTYRASRDGSLTHALGPVTFDVPDGAVLAIVGPSGCGKSTLLHLVAGLARPTLGRITLDGREVTKPAKERVLAFQKPVLYPWLDVFGNVAFGLRIGGDLSMS